ncbi:hypothetical protein PoB_004812100 [Plakobranchus ocellatus]|uniref:Uncharacterized protein n=1 Tax=Plakobranchus ocellatus TaxID=259542 RepID=A0AAV4BRD1_9GAST|nr:hypothetical protein PoB_004812100 [Plakobranchus ocellatus]
MNLVPKGWGKGARTAPHLKNPQRRPRDRIQVFHVQRPSITKALQRWERGEGGRWKMSLEAVSLNPACRRLRTLVAWLLTRRRRHHSAAP